MARALQLAARGLHGTTPNPRVGCVLVKGGQVIAEAWHAYAGGPHAERQALEQAGADARGAVCYLSLEPCAHHGRTPPCAGALLKAGVREVIVAMQDPDPRTSGRGLELLRQHGVKVQNGLMAEQAAELNAGFISRHRHHRPRLSCKLATSMDGRSTAPDGGSQWISSPQARRDVQKLRARSCAILTGAGTAKIDRPRLTVRDPELLTLRGQPLRVVLERRIRLPLDSPMLREQGRTLIITASGPEHPNTTALTARGAQIITLQKRNFLHRAMHHLAGKEHINEVLVEAGPTLSGALIRAGLVDQIILYLAPRLLGHRGNPLLRLPGIDQLRDAIHLDILDLRQVGPDLRLTARIRTKEQE